MPSCVTNVKGLFAYLNNRKKLLARTHLVLKGSKNFGPQCICHVFFYLTYINVVKILIPETFSEKIDIIYEMC